MSAARFYDVIRPFTLRQLDSGTVNARPGDAVRRDAKGFALVRADGSEVPVNTSPSEIGRYVETRLP